MPAFAYILLLCGEGYIWCDWLDAFLLLTDDEAVGDYCTWSSQGRLCAPRDFEEIMRPVRTFDIPCKYPNGLQWVGDELFVIDQELDDVHVLDGSGGLLRTIHTPTENGSGITVGGGFLWTASNGATRARPRRSTDTGLGWVLKLDPESGEMVDRFKTPDGGGIHGIEWDDGNIWVTSFSPKAITLVDGKDYGVIRSFPVELDRLHGLARDGEGIWCAHTTDRVIVRYDVESGRELDRIAFGENGPYPHGLSIRDGELWYCDANYGGGVHNATVRGWAEIGRIVE